MDQITEAIGSPNFTQLASLIAAIGALGAAAAGLVDTTKLFWGGMSNAGFSYIERALRPFQSALKAAAGGDGWKQMLKAHWLNGRPKDEQKAIATSLIRVGLSSTTAPDLAKAAGVDGTGLQQAADALANGTPLTEQQVNMLGRFNASIEARLDAAFERADQYYRNASKTLAALIAVILALVAGGIMYADQLVAAKTAAPDFWSLVDGYLHTRYFPLAVIVGLIAVPLAPVSKDLVSALGDAVRAMKATKG
jgi:hypothetical protein